MTFYLGGTYSIPEGDNRASWYGFNSTPSAIFDGVDESVGGQPSGSMYASYLPIYANRANMSSPLEMSAAYVANGNDMTLTVNIQVDEAISITNNQVSFFVCQEGYHGQSNMVVDMLPQEPFTIDTVGQSTLVSREFTLGSAFNEEDMRIIVLVQNSSTKEILQATMATADYAGSLIVDAEPNGVNAPWNLQGPEGLNFNGSGDRSVNLFFTGDYTLTFLEVPAWTTPAGNPQTQTLNEDETISFFGTYTNGPFTVVNAGPIADAGSGQGVSLVDYDNDGDLDIHVVNNGTADQLLRNEGNLEFSAAATGLIADVGAGSSSAWADFNRDGNQDVFLGRNGQSNLLLVGDGTGGFLPASSVGADDAGPATSVSWTDYDLDGNLDLYIAQSEANLLLNSFGDLGGGFFVFSNSSGAPADGGTANGANWIDLNFDQRPELYIVNSFSANVFLQNTAIGFDNMTNTSGLGDVTNGVGSAWGDYDNDGDFDLYLSNEAMSDNIYNQNGDMLFTPIQGENTEDNGYGRGVVWADFNNDTNLDIYLVRHNQPDLFLLGDGQGGFQRVPVGPTEAEGPGNAIACGDMDNDGDIDLFITRDGQSNVLLANHNLATGNNFFELTLVGSELQPDAIGTVVRLTAGGITQMRHLSAGSGYLAMDAKTIHFGLSDIATIDEVEITWPDGTVQSLTNVAANQFMQVTMGEDALSAVDDGQTLPRATILGQAHPNPFNPSTTIGFALAQSGPTRLDIFTVDGRHVRSLVSGDLNAGQHSVTWAGLDDGGRAVASGAYFYRLSSADGQHQTGRMALVK